MTQSQPAKERSAERWYQFEQIETFRRPIYVKARSLKEARTRITSDGVADYSPHFPDLGFSRRGKIAANQEYVEEFAERDARRDR